MDALAATSPAGRPAWLAFLPSFLFRPGPRVVPYVVKAWMLALIPSLLLSAVIGLAAPGAERPEFDINGPMLPIMIALLVLVGPLIETLLMIVPLLLLNRLLGFGPAVVGSALLWGLAHGLAVPAWGLVTWWPFLILSIALLTWRERGLGSAILVVTAIHGLQNGVAAAAILISATG